MSVAALVLGAGSGSRYRASLGPEGADPGPPKAFVELAGRTLLERSLRALGDCPEITQLVPVLSESDRGRWVSLALALGDLGDRLAQPVAGGAERHDSVRAGLEALAPEIEWVAVHDAARPLVPPGDVRRVVARARETGAAFLGAPLHDTVHRLDGDTVVETPARDTCVAALTPQVFRRDWLEAAHEKARAEGAGATDDVALVARLGVAVHVVRGDPANLKITTTLDLAAALAILRERGEST